MNKANHRIDDLARLAREGCAYRGRSQQADAPLPAISVQKDANSSRPFSKLVSILKT